MSRRCGSPVLGAMPFCRAGMRRRRMPAGRSPFPVGHERVSCPAVAVPPQGRRRHLPHLPTQTAAPLSTRCLCVGQERVYPEGYRRASCPICSPLVPAPCGSPVLGAMPFCRAGVPTPAGRSPLPFGRAAALCLCAFVVTWLLPSPLPPTPNANGSASLHTLPPTVYHPMSSQIPKNPAIPCIFMVTGNGPPTPSPGNRPPILSSRPKRRGPFTNKRLRAAKAILSLFVIPNEREGPQHVSPRTQPSVPSRPRPLSPVVPR